MRITLRRHTIGLFVYAILVLLCAAPCGVLAYGYGEGGYYGYGQLTYYGYGYAQGTYYGYGYGYGQGSYQTTIQGNVLERVNFSVAGDISKASGSFVIDHPLDPKNKLLYHSFVESPDVKNLYDGIVTLDSSGGATVRLPDYFDALNTDVRYQLKPVGSPMPNLHIKTEEKNNQFRIGGGVSGGRVSWQVTGNRHDPYIINNPIIPEVEKGPNQLVDKGEYLYPDAYPSVEFSYALPVTWSPGVKTIK